MKKMDQKLRLNRETLRRLEDLNQDQIARVNGGVIWTGCMSECTECGGLGQKVLVNNLD